MTKQTVQDSHKIATKKSQPWAAPELPLLLGWCTNLALQTIATSLLSIYANDFRRRKEDSERFCSFPKEALFLLNFSLEALGPHKIRFADEF